jgi:beta-glucosidase/6-phospho-beta-glucosidase/beta-galactosidase
MWRLCATLAGTRYRWRAPRARPAIHRGGADLRCCIRWSLIDEFERRDGFGPRRHRIAADYENACRRVPRASPARYAETVGSNSLPARHASP